MLTTEPTPEMLELFFSLALLYVFISGFWEELHPNAYRDIFKYYNCLYSLVSVDKDLL